MKLRQSRHESTLQKEVREGITSQSSVSLQPISDTDRQPISDTDRQPISDTDRQPISDTDRQPISDTDIEQTPAATFLPSVQLLSTDKIVHSEICVFDFETISLSDV